jgi:hypothetical protein
MTELNASAFSFISSAFRHGINERDILNAFTFQIVVKRDKRDENKYLLYGLDLAGNLIEVGFHIGSKTVVFHALRVKKIPR